MKKLISFVLIICLSFILMGCSSDTTTEVIEESDELLEEELEGQWVGTVTGNANIEYEITLVLNESGKFTYQEADTTTSEADEVLLEGIYEVDGDVLILEVTEDQDIPDVFFAGPVTEFTYELSTDYLELEDFDGNIITLTRDGIKSAE